MASSDIELTTSEPDLELKHGRKLRITHEAGGDLVEIRGSSGALEIRIEVTENGPVLRMESFRISLKAAESVDVECKEFRVNAEKGVAMKSQGSIKVTGEAGVEVTANGEVHVKGTKIYLN